MLEQGFLGALEPFARPQVEHANARGRGAVRRDNNPRTEPVIGGGRHHALLSYTAERYVGGQYRVRVLQRVVDEGIDRVPLVPVVQVAPFGHAADQVTVVLALTSSEERAEHKGLQPEVFDDLRRRCLDFSLRLVAADPGDAIARVLGGADRLRPLVFHDARAVPCSAASAPGLARSARADSKDRP